MPRARHDSDEQSDKAAHRQHEHLQHESDDKGRDGEKADDPSDGHLESPKRAHVHAYLFATPHESVTESAHFHDRLANGVVPWG